MKNEIYEIYEIYKYDRMKEEKMTIRKRKRKREKKKKSTVELM
jgi:hypothetical protein